VRGDQVFGEHFCVTTDGITSTDNSFLDEDFFSNISNIYIDDIADADAGANTNLNANPNANLNVNPNPPAAPYAICSYLFQFWLQFLVLGFGIDVICLSWLDMAGSSILLVCMIKLMGNDTQRRRTADPPMRRFVIRENHRSWPPEKLLRLSYPLPTHLIPSESQNRSPPHEPPTLSDHHGSRAGEAFEEVTAAAQQTSARRILPLPSTRQGVGRAPSSTLQGRPRASVARVAGGGAPEKHARREPSSPNQ
jgi:hypothetical protein